MKCTSAIALPIGLVVLLSGCTSIRHGAPAGEPILVSKFVNSLKCEYARAVTAVKGKHIDLKNWSATGSMQLNITSQSTTGGVAKVSGLVPFQGTSLEIGGSASVDRKYTTVAVVPFVLSSKAADASICDRIDSLKIDGGLGFGDWLKSTVQQLDDAEEGDPKIAITSMSYQMVFSLERKQGADGTINIVPLSLTASELATRNDVQTLHIDLNPPAKVIGVDAAGKPVVKPDLRFFRRKIDPALEMSPLLVAPS